MGEVASAAGGKGGGRPDIGEGAATDASQLGAAMDAAARIGAAALEARKQ